MPNRRSDNAILVTHQALCNVVAFTLCVKIMTILSAGALWVKKNSDPQISIMEIRHKKVCFEKSFTHLHTLTFYE